MRHPGGTLRTVATHLGQDRSPSVGPTNLLYHTQNSPKTGYDVWVLPLEGNRKPVLLLGEQFNEWGAVFSPDMHWIAYASTETNPANVFVRRFRVSEAGFPGSSGGKWQVSKDGGNWPRWRIQNEIAFLTRSSTAWKICIGNQTSGARFCGRTSS
jgi:Tol biopolymer transport system component